MVFHHSSRKWLITTAGQPVRSCIHSPFCKGKMLTSYIVSHAGQHTTTSSGHRRAITKHHQLAAAYLSEVKARTQLSGQSLHKLAVANKQSVHRDLVGYPSISFRGRQPTCSSIEKRTGK
jgi:hypothetical protein